MFLRRRRRRILIIVFIIIIILLIVMVRGGRRRPLGQILFPQAEAAIFDRLRNRLSNRAVPAATSQKVSPPQQATSGPGGSDYSHTGVQVSTFGNGDSQYWIFEPTDPKPVTAPVIVFNHGWGGMEPKSYQAWINHIVKKGNIVIYPRYQENLRTSPSQFTMNAIAATKDAIARLQDGTHVTPDLSKFAVVGHSMGGALTANFGALAAENGLPQPRAIMSVAPGKTWNKVQKIAFPLADMSKIPAGTLLLTVIGDTDAIVKDIDAKRIFNESVNVGVNDKDYIIVRSDSHGTPPLKADHFAPVAKVSSSRFGGILTGIISFFRRNNSDDVTQSKGNVDTLDYYGYWKLFDGLYNAAFYGNSREYALGNTQKQRFMGNWSDGVPVKELVVTDQP